MIGNPRSVPRSPAPNTKRHRRGPAAISAAAAIPAQVSTIAITRTAPAGTPLAASARAISRSSRRRSCTDSALGITMASSSGQTTAATSPAVSPVSNELTRTQRVTPASVGSAHARSGACSDFVRIRYCIFQIEDCCVGPGSREPRDLPWFVCPTKQQAPECPILRHGALQGSMTMRPKNLRLSISRCAAAASASANRSAITARSFWVATRSRTLAAIAPVARPRPALPVRFWTVPRLWYSSHGSRTVAHPASGSGRRSRTAAAQIHSSSRAGPESPQAAADDDGRRCARP